VGEVLERRRIILTGGFSMVALMWNALGCYYLIT
jgi:hypothetical protein